MGRADAAQSRNSGETPSVEAWDDADCKLQVTQPEGWTCKVQWGPCCRNLTHTITDDTHFPSIEYRDDHESFNSLRICRGSDCGHVHGYRSVCRPEFIYPQTSCMSC